MKSNLNKGFTLIELLIVISIIGILSSIVLSSLTSAKGKGVNASLKNNLSNLRTQAEIFFDDNGTFSGLCANAKFVSMVNAVHSVSGATAVNFLLATAQTDKTQCHSNNAPMGWVVSSVLKQQEGSYVYWCTDYKGFIGGRVSPLAGSDVNCPAS